MAKSRGLGRGLESLIPTPPPAAARNAAAREKGDAVLDVRVDRIAPNRWQPRRHFDQRKLEELARTIDSHGLMQPLVVRKKADGGYELIAGERRLRAIRDILKRETAPAQIIQADDNMVREMALVENLQRDDLNPIEEAVAYQELHNELGMTHEAIAERVQVSRPKITNAIRLLELPEEIKRLVASGDVAAGSARALLGLTNPVAQLKLARRAVEESLSTRAVERLVAELQKPKSSSTRERAVVPSHVEALEERLRGYFGTKVAVEDDKGRGRIIIEYYSVDDAQRVLDRMGLPPE
ncbi:MAG: ParB/RepB/Spo0J family partition protein [Planctomycetota bacterium]|jgi:ParB family chromosome partitioning protein|nr:ParB/RepB/Spo0J family partition protein [Planctomycetota bacterium]